MQVKSIVASIGMAIFLAFVSPACHSATSGSYWSKIDGVGLWWLYSQDNSSDSIDMEVEPNNPFIEYCNGKNKVYIYELGSKACICQSKKTDYGPTILVRDIGKKLGAVFTVSKNRIEKNNLTPESLGKLEALTARETAKKYTSQIDRDGAYKSELVLGLTACNSRLCSDSYEKKISLGMKDVLIVPTEYLYSEDENLVSSIIVKDSDGYKFLGHIYGCLGQLVDIDGDGVPEIMTKTCLSGLSLSVVYWKIYPEVKLLVQRSGG